MKLFKVKFQTSNTSNIFYAFVIAGNEIEAEKITEADKSLCNDCKDNPIYADYPTQSHFSAYSPVCPLGYKDCIYDPAYILFHHPTYYKEEFGDVNPHQALLEEEYGCLKMLEKYPNIHCYDDEGK